jgi:predicted GNAT family N-acyltransferase
MSINGTPKLPANNERPCSNTCLKLICGKLARVTAIYIPTTFEKFDACWVSARIWPEKYSPYGALVYLPNAKDFTITKEHKSNMNGPISYREFDVSDTAYQQALKLRESILRIPLGLTLSTKDVEWDSQQIHIGAFNQTELIGCIVVAMLENEPSSFRIRQMAVKESYRQKGIGRALVLLAEECIKNNNGTRIVLDARKIALGFYKSLNYTITSDEFIANSIPHLVMEKHC